MLKNDEKYIDYRSFKGKPERVNVLYIGKRCFEFDHGEIRETGFLKDDPDNIWYVIESRDSDGEYALPGEFFDIFSDEYSDRIWTNKEKLTK